MSLDLPTGRIEGEPEGFYHSCGAISRSMLGDFRRRGPQYFKVRYLSDSENINDTDRDTEALRLGSALHCLLLEPERFSERFAVSPKFDRRTKKGREEAEMFYSVAGERVVITEEGFSDVELMVSAVRAHSGAVNLLSQGSPEITWRVDAGDFLLQCRTDWIIEDKINNTITIVDVKADRNAPDWLREDFGNPIIRHSYYRQAAFYTSLVQEVSGSEVDRFVFLVVGKPEGRGSCEPIDVGLFRVPNDILQVGMDEVVGDIQRLSTCINQDEWPSLMGEQERVLYFSDRVLDRLKS